MSELEYSCETNKNTYNYDKYEIFISYCNDKYYNYIKYNYDKYF